MKAKETLNQIIEEYNSRQDLLVTGEAFDISVGTYSGATDDILSRMNGKVYTWSPTASRQLQDIMNIGVHIQRTISAWPDGKETLARLMQSAIEHELGDTRVLLRICDTQVMAILPENHRRVDFAPVARVFADEAQRLGLEWKATREGTDYTITAGYGARKFGYRRYGHDGITLIGNDYGVGNLTLAKSFMFDGGDIRTTGIHHRSINYWRLNAIPDDKQRAYEDDKAEAIKAVRDAFKALSLQGVS